MSQKTDAELTTEAQVIRDETVELANTKVRVYNILKNIIDSKPNNTVIIDHWRGDYAGTTTMPTTGGNFTLGVPAGGDRWRLTNTLTIGGNVYPPGTIIEAMINEPGQTLTNWAFYAMQL